MAGEPRRGVPPRPQPGARLAPSLILCLRACDAPFGDSRNYPTTLGACMPVVASRRATLSARRIVHLHFTIFDAKLTFRWR